MTEFKRVLADFLGDWIIERDIQHQGGADARFEGKATWSPQSDALIYRESGWLSLPGQAPVAAHQRHIWQADLVVSFADGRFFHQVPCAGGATSHWCAPDQYDGVYDFTSWPEFRVTWHVTGPRKAYRMQSRFIKNPV